MASLDYADIIKADPKYTALTDLSLRLEEPDKSKIMTTLIDLLDDKFIDALAEKWSVTGYDGLFMAESYSSKRELIKSAVELHRHKGTVWAVREVLRKLGFGEVEIDEGLKKTYENSQVAAIPQKERWAYYAIRLNKPITNEQAAKVKKILRNFVPARCTLLLLGYREVSIRYNNKVLYNGAYNYGIKGG